MAVFTRTLLLDTLRLASQTYILSVSFSGNPVGYRGRAVGELTTLCLAAPKKNNHVYIHEGHLSQVQCYLRSALFHLSFQYLQMLPPHPANQSYGRAGAIKVPF